MYLSLQQDVAHKQVDFVHFAMLKQKMSNYFVQNKTCWLYLYQNRTNDASCDDNALDRLG